MWCRFNLGKGSLGEIKNNTYESDVMCWQVRSGRQLKGKKIILNLYWARILSNAESLGQQNFHNKFNLTIYIYTHI